MKEKRSSERNLLMRILKRLKKIEADQSLLLILGELKTLQERRIMKGYQMRFNHIDEDLALIKKELSKNLNPKRKNPPTKEGFQIQSKALNREQSYGSLRT